MIIVDNVAPFEKKDVINTLKTKLENNETLTVNEMTQMLLYFYPKAFKAKNPIDWICHLPFKNIINPLALVYSDGNYLYSTDAISLYAIPTKKEKGYYYPNKKLNPVEDDVLQKIDQNYGEFWKSAFGNFDEVLNAQDDMPEYKITFFEDRKIALTKDYLGFNYDAVYLEQALYPGEVKIVINKESPMLRGKNKFGLFVIAAIKNT